MDDAIDRGEPLSPVAMNLKSELDSEAGALSCVGTAALCAEETNERSIPDFSAAVGGWVLPLVTLHTGWVRPGRHVACGPG